MKIQGIAVVLATSLLLTACAKPVQSETKSLEVMYPNSATLFDLDESGQGVMSAQVLTTKVTDLIYSDSEVKVCIAEKCAYTVELPNDKFEQLLSEGRVLSQSSAQRELDGVTLILN